MNEANPEHKDLTKLGEGGTHPNRNLETFPNRNPERDYVEKQTNLPVSAQKRVNLTLQRF